MSARFIDKTKFSSKTISILRYSVGATFIMAFAMASSGELTYIIPMLALSFLVPPIKIDNIKSGIGFILIVAGSSIAGMLFTTYFYNYMLVYIPILALIMIWTFYSTFNFAIKLFILLSFLATPVPEHGLDITVWAKAIAYTLTAGAVITTIVVITVYKFFPDKTEHQKTKTAHQPSHQERFNFAIRTFIVTFPVVLAFIFFQWSNSLLILLYIVVLIMMPQTGKQQGKIKIYGNLIAAGVIIVFYELIVTVPSFFFFIVLYLGTALFFADKIFSGKSYAPYFKSAFSAFTLIIGEVSLGTESAGNEIWIRIIQVMTAVAYVVIALAVIDAFEKKSAIQNIVTSST